MLSVATHLITAFFISLLATQAGLSHAIDSADFLEKKYSEQKGIAYISPAVRELITESEKVFTSSISLESSYESKNVQIKETAINLMLKAGIKNPSVFESSSTTVPLAVGFESLVIPKNGFLKYYSSKELNFILAHEIAHLVETHSATRIQSVYDAENLSESGLSIAERKKVLIDKTSNKQISKLLRATAKNQEHLADIWAVKFLTKYNIEFDAEGVFKKSKYYKIDTESHPAGTTRVQKLKQENLNVRSN